MFRLVNSSEELTSEDVLGKLSAKLPQHSCCSGGGDLVSALRQLI